MDYIGKKFKNKLGLEYVVIKRAASGKGRTNRYLVKFIETGYEIEAQGGGIRDGRVRDKLHKHIYGVACPGYIKQTPEVYQEYNLWSCMIARCYNPKNDNYSNYGGKGVTVCDRWLTFANFYEDISSIEGFNEELFKNKKISLDKDRKQQGATKKVYSLDTCCFLTHSEQNIYADYPVRSFKAISPKGVEYNTSNAASFAREHSLDPSSIIKALHGKLKTVAKWKFYSSEETCNDYPKEE